MLRKKRRNRLTLQMQVRYKNKLLVKAIVTCIKWKQNTTFNFIINLLNLFLFWIFNLNKFNLFSFNLNNCLICFFVICYKCNLGLWCRRYYPDVLRSGPGPQVEQIHQQRYCLISCHHFLLHCKTAIYNGI